MEVMSQDTWVNRYAAVLIGAGVEPDAAAAAGRNALPDYASWDSPESAALSAMEGSSSLD